MYIIKLFYYYKIILFIKLYVTHRFIYKFIQPRIYFTMWTDESDLRQPRTENFKTKFSTLLIFLFNIFVKFMIKLKAVKILR